MHLVRTCLFAISYLLLYCDAYKILVVYILKMRSHSNLGDALVRNLLKDGHEVTYITPILTKDHPNLRQIDVGVEVDILPSYADNIYARLQNRINYPTQAPIMKFCSNLSRLLLTNKDVQALMNDVDEEFDAVIASWNFSEVLAGLSTVFNCPLIWLSPLEVNWVILNLIGESSNPAYSTDIISNNQVPFTFVQRVEELWAQLRTIIYRLIYEDKVQSDIYDEMFAPAIIKRGRKPPAFSEVQYNASLVLANSHPSMGPAVPVPPNYKPIGGYYIEDVKPLPQLTVLVTICNSNELVLESAGSPLSINPDLQKIMDNSKHGVIYFSLGSNVKSKDIPNDIKRNIIDMFGTLKYTVFWKYEETLDNLPNNVHIMKWAPQNSILAHPKCVLFITHGGLLSTTETVHFGVPIVGIPMYLDQFINIIKVVNKGIGVRVDMTVNVAHDLKVAIEEVLKNKSYSEKVKELSFIYHDRPVKPGAELVHWVKHVVRTRGAPHLRSPASLVPLYQKLYLDLFFIIAVLIIGVYKASGTIAKLCSRPNLDSKKVN